MRPLFKQLLKIIGGACLIGGFGVFLLCLYFIKIENDFEEYTLDNKFIVRHCTWGNKIYLMELQTRKKITPKMDDIRWFGNDDTLAVFIMEGKCGYLNKRTGKIQLSATYDHAWRFSEGLAVIMDGKNLCIINGQGQLVKKIGNWNLEDVNVCPPVFTNGFCILRKNGLYGLWDHYGICILEPKYDTISHCNRGYWKIKSNERYGLIDSLTNWVLPIQYDAISIHSNGITVRQGYDQKLLSLNGKLILNSHIYDGLWVLSADPLYYQYQVFDKCGLMDKNMKPICLPLYKDINILYDHIFCAILDDGKKIIINTLEQ